MLKIKLPLETASKNMAFQISQNTKIQICKPIVESILTYCVDVRVLTDLVEMKLKAKDEVLVCGVETIINE